MAKGEGQTQTQGAPSLLIVDDERGLRFSLGEWARDCGFRPQEAASSREALEVVEKGGADVVLLDLKLGDEDGLQVLRRLRENDPTLPVIMLTGHGTVEMCRRAFKAGAAEFLEKPVDDEALLEALQSAVRQHVKSRERLSAGREARERYAQLSEREREVLGLIVSGLTNKEIGRALTLSPRTVETHRANLFAKLETASLAQLIRQYASLADEGGAA
jgi:FixJ family two-component response regulator